MQKRGKVFIRGKIIGIILVFLISCVSDQTTTESTTPEESTITTGSTITTVSFDESSGSDFPVTFGLLFKEGDVPLGKSVIGSIDSSNISIQVDQVATHSDSSYRYAILSAIIPAGATTMDIVVRDGTFTGTPVSVDSNHGTNVTIDSTTVSLTQFVEDWLSGSIVTERVYVAYPTLHITVFLNVRKYSNGATRHEVVVENSAWALKEGGFTENYTYAITIGGQTKDSGSLEHIHNTRWRELFWETGDDGIVKYAPGYLQSTKGILNYNPNRTIDEGTLSGYASSLTSSNFDKMGPGNFNKGMPNTGQAGAPHIGPIPGWGVSYLMTMDNRARAITLANSDCAGHIPWHFRYEQTLQPIGLADIPDLVINTRYEPKGTLVAQASGSDGGWVVDTAHQPGHSFISALITGDRYYFEEMFFVVGWNSMWPNPSYRKDPVLDSYEDGIMQRQQVRGQAWTLRTLSDAEYITADDHFWKPELRKLLENNLNYYWKSFIESGTYAYGYADNFGTDNAPLWHLGEVWRLNTKYPTLSSPWEQDYLQSIIALMADRGDPRAVELASWKGRGGERFDTGNWCRNDAGEYKLELIDPDTLVPRSSWEEVIGGDPNCPGPMTFWNRYSSYPIIALGASGAAATYNSGALNGHNWLRSEFAS